MSIWYNESPEPYSPDVLDAYGMEDWLALIARHAAARRKP